MAVQAERRLSARDRLLDAANELFYEEGVQTVGIDRVIEHAGVAKASLYNSFGSKDELVRAYLERRHALRQEAVANALALVESPRERVLAMFDLLGDLQRAGSYRGCAFVNASTEARPGSGAEQATRSFRDWMRSVFVELATQAGAADPQELARGLQLLYDGAGIAVRIDHDSQAATAARRAAEQLLDAATAKAGDCR
jgi:AcrR family transcriptional regulator